MKKKTAVNLSDRKSIAKQFGKVLSTGTELLGVKQDLKCLTASPSMDLALNGGLLEGSWNIISGAPKVGKSSFCLQVCKNAQDDGRPIIYVDAETRLKDYNLLGIEGLDLSKFEIVHGSNEDSDEQLSAEDFLKITESLMKMPSMKGAVCVIDSCSSLVPRAELDEDPSATLRASLPKLLSHWIKKNAQTVVKNRIIVLIITHYITNTSGYGKAKIPDCGVMVQYQADTRLDVSKVEAWEEDDKKIGQLIHWTIGCSAMGASGTECINYLRYGVGIDKRKEVIEMAESFDIINKAGAWYSIPFLEGDGYDTAPKFQGQAKLYNFIEQNPEAYSKILLKVKEMLE